MPQATAKVPWCRLRGAELAPKLDFMIDLTSLAGLAGGAAGLLLAPLFGIGSYLRQARFFHPRGVCYRADVQPAAGPLHALGARLGPAALVRLSGAWWRSREWPDVLGIALRFQASPGAAPTDGDQDLLLATIPLPVFTPLAPLWTNVHDFLDNTYYGVSPFAVTDIGSLRFRLRPAATSPAGADRSGRLAAATAAGIEVLQLQAQSSPGASWHPVADLHLTAELVVDQEALRFSPFRQGRGIAPRGFIHGLRRSVYLFSQASRPAS